MTDKLEYMKKFRDNYYYLTRTDQGWLISEVERLREELADIENSHRFVMAEDCPTDEVHCGCVPILKAENARLLARIKELEDANR